MYTSANKITAIIVDDESKAIKLLAHQIQEFCSEVEVIGTAQCVDDAKILIEKHQPTVVFLDIEMPEKSGFELFDVTEVNFQTIFVTSYSHYAIKAFEVSAVDYLLKPVDEDRLRDAVGRVVKKRDSQLVRIKALQSNLENGKINQIVIPTNEYKIVIKTSDIICAEADRAYTKIYYVKNNELEVVTFTRNMNYFENLVKDIEYMMRIHRSWVININKTEKFLKKNRMIKMEKGIETTLSRTMIKAFEERMK